LVTKKIFFLKKTLFLAIIDFNLSFCVSVFYTFCRSMFMSSFSGDSSVGWVFVLRRKEPEFDSRRGHYFFFNIHFHVFFTFWYHLVVGFVRQLRQKIKKWFFCNNKRETWFYVFRRNSTDVIWSTLTHSEVCMSTT